jgi:hypothetical protein
MRSGASCGQAGDPAGSTSTSCGPLATGQRRVWDSSSPGSARPRWPAIVCGVGSRSCGARSCSIPSRSWTCSSGPGRRVTQPRLGSCGPTCWRGPAPCPSPRCQPGGIDDRNGRPSWRASPAADPSTSLGAGSASAAAGSSHPFLPSLDLAGAAAGLSLYPHLLRLRPGGARTPWGAARQLVGHPSNRPVPSMASGWRRSGSLTR